MKNIEAIEARIRLECQIGGHGAQSRLSEEIGVTSSTITKWVNDGIPRKRLAAETVRGLLAWYESLPDVRQKDSSHLDDLEDASRVVRLYGVSQCASVTIDFGDIRPDSHEEGFEKLNVPSGIAPRSHRLASFKAEGMSMWPDIRPNEICIIDSDADVNVGDAVLCKYDGVVLCKYWNPVNGVVVLTSANTEVGPINAKLDKIEWVHKIIYTMRKR